MPWRNYVTGITFRHITLHLALNSYCAVFSPNMLLHFDIIHLFSKLNAKLFTDHICGIFNPLKLLTGGLRTEQNIFGIRY
jgi:hypothetical protein